MIRATLNGKVILEVDGNEVGPTNLVIETDGPVLCGPVDFKLKGGPYYVQGSKEHPIAVNMECTDKKPPYDRPWLYLTGHQDEAHDWNSTSTYFEQGKVYIALVASPKGTEWVGVYYDKHFARAAVEGAVQGDSKKPIVWRRVDDLDAKYGLGLIGRDDVEEHCVGEKNAIGIVREMFVNAEVSSVTLQGGPSGAPTP